MVLTGVPLLTYVVAPALEKSTVKWIDFGPADQLTQGEIEMLFHEFVVKDGLIVLPQRGFVWVKSEAEKLTVFSSICTHLACNFIWNKEKEIFEYPCHSGLFDREGRPVAGPPAQPLVVMEHKVEEGKLMILITAKTADGDCAPDTCSGRGAFSSGNWEHFVKPHP